VAIALSMVYAGAKDETAEQMNKLLANGSMDGNLIKLKIHTVFLLKKYIIVNSN
jgi:serine protease inhibitor